MKQTKFNCEVCKDKGYLKIYNKMKNKTKKIITKIFKLHEYQRKQIISILIASMLNDLSNKEANKIYDEIITKLSNH